MRLPGSQLHRPPRLRPPILPSPDPTPPQSRRPRLHHPPPVDAQTGTRYARPAPARYQVPSPPVPTNPTPESSSISPVLCVERGQDASAFHATQPARDGQAIETFRCCLPDENVESFVGSQKERVGGL